MAGLPTPEPGREVHDEYGSWVATVDLQYRAQRIAIEYDGDLHRTSKRKWRNDIATRRKLRALGWEVIVLTVDDLYLRPYETLCYIHTVLLERGRPDVPVDLPASWSGFSLRAS
jgi:very-short-patch-repair endonuclease